MLLHTFFLCLRAPLAEDKRQPLASTGVFLGMEHDVQHAFTAGTSFWPKDTLIEKLQAMCTQALAQNSLTPAGASKLRGVGSFAAHAFWSKVLQAAMCTSSSVSTPTRSLGR